MCLRCVRQKISGRFETIHLYKKSLLVASVNGGRPMTIQKRTMARAKMSTSAPLQGAPRFISGAMYPGVPSLVVKKPQLSSPVMLAEKPKSSIFGTQPSYIMMLSDLMSRWTRPLLWICYNACTNGQKICLATDSFRAPLQARKSISSTPSTCSRAMNYD